MKIKKNENLSSYTTIKIGGNAEELYMPESVEELSDLCKNKEVNFFIGGGSNLLIANRNFPIVVCLKEFNNTIEDKGNGEFLVGASVRLQKLINYINEKEYGGIEYLYSVPGLIGGAVAMNAGRGAMYNQSISDFIISVDVMDSKTGEIQTYSKQECDFSYRNSIFKGDSSRTIVSILFSFQNMSIETSEKLKKERIELCKEVQDTSKPNFGSVFVYANTLILKMACKMGMGKNVHFSKKTKNWIINEGGTYEDAINLIHKVEKIHKFLRLKCEREVIVWE